ncbi:hypothetical protein L218DRAFT_1077882 [Marasmius fiardii PR-910]|nr:hypothetical protein L218DRAFT_1077882 [Marasmius fiardii PR-910]
MSATSPRSLRVGITRPPTDLKLIYDPSSLSPPSSPVTSSPPPPSLPARSPLRPTIRYSGSPISPSTTDQRLSSDSSFSAKLLTPPSSEDDEPTTTMAVASTLQLHDALEDSNFSSLHELLGGTLAIEESVIVSTTKPMALRPESPLAPSPMDEEVASSSSSFAGQSGQTTTLSKRQHALHELLASERAYASDLALVREVYIPLALGQPVLAAIPPETPPHSSASSSRTMSIASDSSTSSIGLPMTAEDAKIIFNNIAELARFSDRFCEQLEEALGSNIDGGVGEDHVGELFLQIIPEMERPYKQYITRQGSADEHLQNLPKTPALEAYFTQTRNYSTSVSHAWDLHSLLIKPVQRLLKYPLLLGTILESTADTHSDKENLRSAKAKIEVVARNVNEERRRAEVVKGILMGDPKKKSLPSAASIGVAASVNLSKMKSLKKVGQGGQGSMTGSASAPSLGGIGGDGVDGMAAGSISEAVRVERMTAELKRIEVYAQQLAKNVVDWSKGANAVVHNLRLWAAGFGRVIGLSDEQGSEAFDAFLAVLDEQLTPLSGQLETAINEKLLKEIATLLSTLRHPWKLLTTMEEQEPYHYHLLNMNVTPKNRPPAALLEASTNYLALRGQLANELPKYIELMHRGLAIVVKRLTEIQTHYWMEVRDRWSELWEMLRVEGEMNAGAEETIGVWHARWTDVDETVRALRITNIQKLTPEHPSPPQQYTIPMPSPIAEQMMYLHTQHTHQQQTLHKTPSLKKTTSSAVANVLSSLDPAHSQQQQNQIHFQVSPPYPLSPTVPSSARGRGRGHSDASMVTTASSTNSKRRESNDSFKNKNYGTTKASPQPRPHASDEWDEFFPPAPAILGNSFSLPRTRSMPLPKHVQGVGEGGDTFKLPQVDTSPIAEDFFFRSGGEKKRNGERKKNDGYDERGRKAGSSLKKKLGDTIRSTSRPGSSKGQTLSPTPTYTSALPRPTSSKGQGRASLPANALFSTSTSDDAKRNSWSHAPGKYTCLVIHPCRPPAPVAYHGFPFFTLVEGDVYHVLHEAGHPSLHKKLPLYVDDGEDCLLLCRQDDTDVIGWALASFLEPMTGFEP